jgi:hypothetical protein
MLVKVKPTTTTAGSTWFCCEAKARVILDYYGRQTDDENQAAQNALEANCENSFGGPTTKKKTSLWCYLLLATSKRPKPRHNASGAFAI